MLDESKIKHKETRMSEPKIYVAKKSSNLGILPCSTLKIWSNVQGRSFYNYQWKVKDTPVNPIRRSGLQVPSTYIYPIPFAKAVLSKSLQHTSPRTSDIRTNPKWPTNSILWSSPAFAISTVVHEDQESYLVSNKTRSTLLLSHPPRSRSVRQLLL